MSYADDETDAARTAPGVHHLALRAADLEVTVAFYTELMGLREARSSRPRSVWLALGGGAVLMVEAREADEPPIAAGSLELIAFGVGEELKRDIRARARERGCFDGETVYTVYLRDPDGRRVGVSTYPLDAA